jgi:hypothetical protein
MTFCGDSGVLRFKLAKRSNTLLNSLGTFLQHTYCWFCAMLVMRPQPKTLPTDLLCVLKLKKNYRMEEKMKVVFRKRG